MQNWYFKIRCVSSLLVFCSITFLILFVTGCRNHTPETRKLISPVTKDASGSDGYVSYIKFRSFQNSDSTWGFTIFVNSKPYLQHRKIPFTKAASGFKSKNDAEKVATQFVRIIEKVDLTPDLNEKLLDSLGISLN